MCIDNSGSADCKMFTVSLTAVCSAPQYYTVSQEKFQPLNSLQLCQILADSQIFFTAGKRMKFATNSYDIAHLTLITLLQYLGKSKIRISADIQPIWKKMHPYGILIASNFVIRP